MKKPTRVSICIPAHNEETNIGYILSSLTKQKTDLVAINKIIVVSSASTDRTDMIVEDFARNNKQIILLKQPERRGKADAINAFLKVVDDPLVVIQSADTIALEDTIENLCAPLVTNPAIGMTGGAPIPVNDPHSFLGYIIHAWWWFHRNIPRFGEIIAYRNLLSEISATTAVDEAYIQAKIIQLGYSIVHVDSAVVRNKGPETVADLIKQRRRVFNGHARLHQEESIKIDNMTRSSMHLLLYKYKLHNLKELMWFTGGILIEIYARGLGYYDMKYKNKNPFIWDIAKSTKSIFSRRSRKNQVVFLNFAPIEFMGGAEKWMNDTAQKLHRYENTIVFSVAPNLANLYGKLVLKRSFEKRISPEKLHNHVYLGIRTFIPFTHEWQLVRNYFKTSRLIYTKYELLEVMIILYFGGFSVLKKTVAGLHSPLIYFSPKGFWDNMHNTVYKSKLSMKVLSLVKKVHVLNKRTENILTDGYKLHNITYMPNSVVPLTNGKPLSEAKPGILKVLYAGELSERKGVDVLIEIIKNAHPNFEFSIAGNGYMKQEIQALSDALPNCHYLGYMSPQELAHIYGENDVLLFPSRAESMSLTMLEAMSHGLTIVNSQEASLGLDKQIEQSCDNNRLTTYYYALSYLYKLKKQNNLSKTYVKKYFQDHFSPRVVDPQVFEQIFELRV